jgi:hypothetical protein
MSAQELEAQVLERYQRRELSEEEVRHFLGLRSRFDVHELLARRGMCVNYNEEDLEEDRKFVDSWLSSQTPHR